MNTEDINIEKKAENIEEDINQSAIKDDETQTMSENDNNENNQDLNSEAEKLNVVEEELKQLKDNYIRKVAEFENYKKRTLKEKTELILNGSEKTVIAILPILDDFERAISDKSDDPKAIKEGMQLIFNKFNKILESIGVNKIETEGKDFDVDYHEAVAMLPTSDDDKKGKVIDCVQTGYTLNNKVIRHAKVAVGQ
ncbi:nucleotide exchange factor GrpE [Prevotella sp. HCN-7019]|uniref:nucleotide exchange factor GrpE n=1 Tax=Prevotella sp. HCN-7019 TaxID=3134668 RepID=UPI0030BACD07